MPGRSGSGRTGRAYGEQVGTRRRRDRRGHGLRGPLLPPHAPAHRSRAEHFDTLVLDAVGRLGRAWGEELARVDVAVEDVPPSDPAPWEEQAVPLGRVFPADGPHQARLVVYRRPVEARADEDLPRLVHQVVVEQVAALLARTPEEIDPHFRLDED